MGLTEFIRRRERRRFSRENQLAIVCAGNAMMFLIVGVIALLSTKPADFRDQFPSGFWVLELVIIGSAGLLSMMNLTALIEALQEFRKFKVPKGTTRLVDVLRGVALLGVYVMQLAALYFLLRATGGPIHSPFAPMALVTIIFTPFLANNPWTVVVVLVLTAVFYTVVVVENGTKRGEASPWVYAAVNLLIVGLALLPSLLELFQASDEENAPTEDPDAGLATVTVL